MSLRKSIRVTLLLAVSAVLLAVAAGSPRRAKEMEKADDIAASLEDAFVEGNLALELSNAGDYPIYYTLDGSVPTLDSALYEGPITLDADDQVRACAVRARAWEEDEEVWGDLFTRTYFYARKLETIKERFSTYIVCLTSAPYDLYDYEHGILVEGKIRDEYVQSEDYISDKLTKPANFTQEGREWERDTYVEILSPDGERLISQDAGIRIFGHASRQYYYKSFKLYAREEYGKASFDYPLFPDNIPLLSSGVQDSYERLVVRAHGFDKSVTLFREELFQRLMSQIDGIDSKSVAPASVWLNGAYYNFEWLQEVYDDCYMEKNYGYLQQGDEYRKVALRADKPTASVPPDETSQGEGCAMKMEVPGEGIRISLDNGGMEEDFLLANSSRTSKEDIEAARDYAKAADYAEQDLTDDKMFDELCNLVDMENMMQYFAIETYIANWDWPLNNVKLYRYYSSNGNYGTGRQDGRWRYLYYDMEAGFNIYNEDAEDWLKISDVMEESSLFGAVIRRRDMQERFAYYMGLCINEYFTEDRVRAAVEELKAQRDKEMAESFAYKQSIDETYTLDMEEVGQNIEVIYDFLERRPDMMREELSELFGIQI